MVLTNATVVSDGLARTGMAVKVSEGRIENVCPMSELVKPEDRIIDIKGNILCPGLIDTHIHGIGGYATDDLSKESILGMSEALASCGITSFLPTLYPDTLQSMYKAQNAILQAMGNEKGATILGMNLEGPFISPQKPGALSPEAILEPSEQVFESFVENGKGKLVCMTVAPEVNNIEKIAELAKKHGIILLAGHSNCTYEEAKTAKKYGIMHVTHMFNAMSRMDHRSPGLAGFALTDDDIFCEMIADGVHVHRDIVMHVLKTKPEDKVILITDSLKPTNQKEGVLTANGTEVFLDRRGAFVAKDNPDLLCGSALTLNNAVKNVTGWGMDIAQAVRTASQNPAQLYGFRNKGRIAQGFDADLSVFDKTFRPLLVMVGGNIVVNEF